MDKKVGPFLLSCRRDYYHGVMDEDLWAEILKRLPIKSLCRFLSVSKGWNSLISSAFFINLHLSYYCSTTPRNLKPYLRVVYRHWRMSDDPEYFSLCRPLDDGVEHSRQELHCPFRSQADPRKRSDFVDAIHGVVCLSYSSRSTNYSLSPSFNSIILLNPSIHKYVPLPYLSLTHHYRAIGFGYDTSKSDFKVVLILEGGVQGASFHVTYQLYSARQCCWRPPVTTTAGIHLKRLIFVSDADNCCYVNGTIHWLVSSSYDYGDGGRFSLLMFGCELEVFTSIAIPGRVFPLPLGPTPSVELLEYGGMLAVLVLDSFTTMNVWVMEEHGVSNSWKKLLTICRPEGRFEWRITKYDPSFENLAPYDPKKQWMEDPSLFRHIMSLHAYEETMFLMDHPKAQSYAKKEVISILTKDPRGPDLKQKEKKKRKKKGKYR